MSPRRRRIKNAGYYISELEEAITTEQARRLMDTNFLGPVRVNRAVPMHMRRQRSGVLMHVSSAAGRVMLHMIVNRPFPGSDFGYWTLLSVVMPQKPLKIQRRAMEPDVHPDRAIDVVQLAEEE
jgi:hypothetical protein